MTRIPDRPHWDRMTRRRNQAAGDIHEEENALGVSEHETELMGMMRMLLEEQRQAEGIKEEARRQEDLRIEEARRQEALRQDQERLEREAEIARKQVELQAELERKRAELQAAAEKRQYEQQVAIVKLQAELGEKASRAHRDMQNSDRKRDRALFSIPVYREGEDIEAFLSTAERRLGAAEIPQGEWIPIMDTKLSGSLSTAWQDITIVVGDYAEARDRLLKVCGYTPRLAADSFYGFRVEQSKGLTADQLYHRGLQLMRRVLAPIRISEAAEYALLKGWIGNVISRKARAALDARVVSNAAELINALQDFLALDGGRNEGQAATFGRGNSEAPRERSVGGITCYKCGRVGHKAADCWGGRREASGPKVGSVAAGSVGTKIICYTCGEEGHKSPQCPKNQRGEKAGNKEAKPKPIKRIWKSQTGCVQLEGIVNGHEAQVLLDSGADISVVPEDMVSKDQLCGENVAVKPFGATTAMLLPLAEIEFGI